MESKRHQHKHLHLLRCILGAVSFTICVVGVIWPAVDSFEKDKDGVRVAWEQVWNNLWGKYLANMSWANLVALAVAGYSSYKFLSKYWRLFRVAAERDSVPKQTKRLFVEQLDRKEQFNEAVLRSLRNMVEPIMQDGSTALKEISSAFEDISDSDDQFDSTVQQLISCLLTAHGKAQFENLGSGGHRPGKRLLITNFYSYATYVTDLIAKLRASKPKGYSIWCFSTWSQPMDKWFNYLPGIFGEFHQGQKHWTDYLDFWERELSRTSDKLFIERCVLFSKLGNQNQFPILTDDQFAVSLQKQILVEKHGDTTKRRTFTREALITLFQTWETESPTSQPLIKHLKDSILKSITDGGHAHVIVSKDRTVGMSPPSGYAFLPLRDVFYKNFHRAIPGSGVHGASEFEVKITDADKLGAGEGGLTLPDDLFVLGLCQRNQTTWEAPIPLMAIGGDLDLGVQGFGLEFVTKKTDTTRWDEVVNWMTDVRRRSVELRAIRVE